MCLEDIHLVTRAKERLDGPDCEGSPLCFVKERCSNGVVDLQDLSSLQGCYNGLASCTAKFRLPTASYSEALKLKSRYSCRCYFTSQSFF